MRAGGSRVRGYFLFVNFIAIAVALALFLFSFSNLSAQENLSETNQTPANYTIQISNIQILPITNDSTTISWQTDIASDTKIFYRVTDLYTTITIEESVMRHSVSLTGLLQNTNYFFYIQSCDALVCANSTESNFTTLQNELIPSPSPNATVSPSPSATVSPTPTINVTPSPSIIAPSPSIGALITRLIARKRAFRITEASEFDLTLEQGASITKAEIFDATGLKTDAAIDISPRGANDFLIKVNKKRQLRAGIYKMRLEINKGGIPQILEQDYAWGVLAINTDKSIYNPNEQAFIAMGVLNDAGQMVCDAQVTLQITDPAGAQTILSTQNGLITVSPDCFVHGVTLQPDYYAYYQTSSPGTYSMTLTAITANGERTITDEFFVEQQPDFDVRRSGPTRITPTSIYEVGFEIKANRRAKGITEYVPASFEITAQPGLSITIKGDAKELFWDLQLQPNQTLQLKYQFDAPDISPYLFLLGPLQIGNWEEKRQWQIASDPDAGPPIAFSNTVLRAQLCSENNGNSGVDQFTGACAGSYPSNGCNAGQDLVSCDDPRVETQTGTQDGGEGSSWIGMNITVYNSTITNCGGIYNVTLCNERWVSASVTGEACAVSVDNTETGTWSNVDLTCPGTTANPGISCVDATTNAAWACSNFFGSSGRRARARIINSVPFLTTRTITVDVFWFNVSYFIAGCDGRVDTNRNLDVDIFNQTPQSCMNITQNNVIFDCRGHQINGSGVGVAFNVTKNNVVIKNCVIKGWDKGINAVNAINLTLTNNTFINNSNYSIFIQNSASSAFSYQNISHQRPRSISTSPGIDAYGIYLNNVSNSAATYNTIYGVFGGATTASAGNGGHAYGVYLLNSYTNIISHNNFNTIQGAAGSATTAAGGIGGNATAYYLLTSTNNFMNNNTIANITAGAGANGANANPGSAGGAGGYSHAFFLLNAINTTVANTTSLNITAGAGGNGGNAVSGTNNGGAAANGGSAYLVFATNSSSSFFNSSDVTRVAGALGGNGGSSSGLGPIGGKGGKGGHSFAYFFTSSPQNYINLGQVDNITAGNGGAGGTSAETDGDGGIGGNASFLYIERSNFTFISNSWLNSSIGGTGGASSTGLPADGGYSFGIFLSGNLSIIRNVTVQNVLGGPKASNGLNDGQARAINFLVASHTDITNSSFSILYARPAYTVFSEQNSSNNTFINTTFNRSANGWGSVRGTTNFTVKWYVQVNVTDSTGLPVSGSLVNIYNITNSALAMLSPISGSNGLTDWQILTEYVANGSYSYGTFCTPQVNVSCFNPHNFSILADYYKPNSTAINITNSTIVWVTFAANSAPTHNNPTFNPSPPDPTLNLTCLNQSTTDSDGDPVVNIYSFRFNASGGLANDTSLLYLPFDTEVTYSARIPDYSPANVSFYRGIGTSSPRWIRFSNETWGSSVLGGGAYLFDGGDFLTISLSEAPHLNLTNNFTMSVWFNASDFANNQRLLSSRLGAGNNNGNLIYIATSSGDGAIVCDIGNGTGFTKAQFRTPNAQWANRTVFVACTYNTTSAVLYVNGSEVNRSDLPSPVVASTTLSANNFSIGKEGGSAINFFTGIIDEVRIYNKTLSPEQINMLYLQRFNSTAAQELANSMNATCCVTPTDLVAVGLMKCVGETVTTPASTVSFTVFTLGGGGNQTISKSALPGNFTENYFFNTTNQFEPLLAPCAAPIVYDSADSRCQNGMGKPAYRIRNTGNANSTIWVNISASLSSANIKLCANSTAPTGCSTTLVPNCDLTGEGNVNASAWLRIAYNLGQDSVCYDANVTIYANFSGTQVATPTTVVFSINSTLT